MQVTSHSIDEILKGLREGEWTVPSFQREFVWSVGQVCALVESILKGRPIGIATLWVLKQADADSHRTQVISLNYGKQSSLFSPAQPAAKQCLILDGRQRSTALAMAFGGLRTDHGNSPYAGSFFADLDGDDGQWVVFKRKKEVIEKGLGALSGALGQGLLPLDFRAYGSEQDKLISDYLMRALDVLAMEQVIYPQDRTPATETTLLRKERIKTISAGVVATRLATCELDDSFDIADICDVFETLNQTGVKVSTVDLLHTSLYDQITDPATGGFFNLRAWWNELGQSPGAARWSSADDNPERVAQMVAAAHAAADTAGRIQHPITGKVAKFSGISSRDILQTPAAHWREIVSKAGTTELAELIGDFQDAVVGPNLRFPASKCPYPSISSVYIGLRWSRIHQSAPDSMWEPSDLEMVFRSYFWNSIFYQRYDQGMVARVAADMQSIRGILRDRANFSTANDWRTYADERVASMFVGADFELDAATLARWILDGNIRGARRAGILLPVWTRPKLDLLSGETIDIVSNDNIQLHHIWPKKWIADNRHGDVASLFDQAESDGEDRVNCAANMLPLTSDSNNWWKSKSPAQALIEKNLSFGSNPGLHEAAFLNEAAFSHLATCDIQAESSSLREFLVQRAETLAEWLFRQTRVYIGATN